MLNFRKIMKRPVELIWFTLFGFVSAQGVVLESDLRINGAKVEQVFEPHRELLQESSAVIYGGSRSIGYAVILSADGYLLTKASEIDGVEDLSVRIGRKKYVPEVISQDTEWDVCLLKIEASDLVMLEWGEEQSVSQGSWVVCNGSTSRSRRRISVGIISAHSRHLPGAVPVVIGVGLAEEEGELKVTSVTEDSGADEAGLEKGDILLECNGVVVESHEFLQDLLRTMQAGDIMKLRYQRGDEEHDTEVKLRGRHFFDQGPVDRNDQMSGRYSIRRDSFPMILQHDIPLSRRSCGGPLLDLDGRCIGMNIARANRAETFAIPVNELRALGEKMISEATGETQSPQ